MTGVADDALADKPERTPRLFSKRSSGCLSERSAASSRSSVHSMEKRPSLMSMGI